MKKIFVTTSCCLLAVSLLCSCRQHDWRELSIHVPEMTNEVNARLVLQALGRGPGFDPATVVLDRTNNKVTFKYDSLLAADKNFEYLVADAGFTANGIPPRPASGSR